MKTLTLKYGGGILLSMGIVMSLVAGAGADVWKLTYTDSPGQSSFDPANSAHSWTNVTSGGERSFNVPNPELHDFLVESEPGVPMLLRTPDTSTVKAVFPGKTLTVTNDDIFSVGATLTLKAQEVSISDLTLKNAKVMLASVLNFQFSGQITIPEGFSGGFFHEENDRRNIALAEDSILIGSGDFLLNKVYSNDKMQTSYYGDSRLFSGKVWYNNQANIIFSDSDSCFGNMAEFDEEGFLLEGGGTVAFVEPEEVDWDAPNRGIKIGADTAFDIVGGASVWLRMPISGTGFLIKTGYGDLYLSHSTGNMPIILQKGALGCIGEDDSVFKTIREPRLYSEGLYLAFDLHGDSLYDVSATIAHADGQISEVPLKEGVGKGSYSVFASVPNAQAGDLLTYNIVSQSGQSMTLGALLIEAQEAFRISANETSSMRSLCYAKPGRAGGWISLTNSAYTISYPSLTNAEYVVDSTAETGLGTLTTFRVTSNPEFTGRRIILKGSPLDAENVYTAQMLNKYSGYSEPKSIDLCNGHIIQGMQNGSFRCSATIRIPEGCFGKIQSDTSDGRTMVFTENSGFYGAGELTFEKCEVNNKLFLNSKNCEFFGKTIFDCRTTVTFGSEDAWFGDMSTFDQEGFTGRGSLTMQIDADLDWEAPNRGFTFEGASTINITDGKTLKLYAPIVAPEGLELYSDGLAIVEIATTEFLKSGSIFNNGVDFILDGDAIDGEGVYMASRPSSFNTINVVWDSRKDFSQPLPLVRFPSSLGLTHADFTLQSYFPEDIGTIPVLLLDSEIDEEGNTVIFCRQSAGAAVSIMTIDHVSGTEISVQCGFSLAEGCAVKVVATPESGEAVEASYALEADAGTVEVSLGGLLPNTLYKVQAFLERDGERLSESYIYEFATVGAGEISGEVTVVNASDGSKIDITVSNVYPGAGESSLIISFNGMDIGVITLTNAVDKAETYVYSFVPDIDDIWDVAGRFSARVENSCSGVSFTSEAVSTSSTYTLADKRTYTWIGEEGAEWEDAKNWYTGSVRYGLGYPNGESTIAHFTNAFTRVKINGNVCANELIVNKPNVSVQFEGDGADKSVLSVNYVSLSYQNNVTLIWDNIKFAVGNTYSSGFDFRSSNTSNIVFRAQNNALLTLNDDCINGTFRFACRWGRLELDSSAIAVSNRFDMGGIGTQLKISNSRIDCKRVVLGTYPAISPNNDDRGQKITIEGKASRFRVTSDFGVYDSLNDYTICFKIPDGGYDSVPLDLTGVQYPISGNTPEAHGPIVFTVDPDSPAFKTGSFEQTLVALPEDGSIPFGSDVALVEPDSPQFNRFTYDGETFESSVVLGFKRVVGGTLMLVK